MIQILGLREYVDHKTGEVKTRHAFFQNNWRAPDIFELFANAQTHANNLPEDQRWNMFYTLANCTDKQREFHSQDVIPLDIDGIVHGDEAEIVRVVCKELGLNPKDLGIVFSGNGVHILIGLSEPMPSLTYLNGHKAHYKALCGRVNTAMFNAGLAGKADPTALCAGRMFRLPYTVNKKPKGEKLCTLVNGTIRRLDTDLPTLAQMPTLQVGEYISPRALRHFPDPDAEAVQKGCGFLKHCFENQDQVLEPEWYAMLSIVGRLPDGERLVHAYSQRYSKYNPDETDRKLAHALDSAGPRTCENISQYYSGCQACPHYNKIASPIQIVGKNTIRTQKSGFWNTALDKDGNIKKTTPNYDDLEKFFRTKYNYVTLQEDRETSYFYGDTHWEPLMQLAIHAFVEKSMDPKPKNTICNEFEGKLKRNSIVPSIEMNRPGYLNFMNGVLDLEEGVIGPHKDTYKFTYVIPYAYEPQGDCPIFKKFLADVSCDDEEMVQMLAEYIGYCISGTDPELVQKCAILYGDGANGKSVLINLMRELVGPQNCSAMGIDSIKKDTHRYQLMNKHFNAAAEAPSNAFLDSEIFKDMVAGGTIEVRKLYGDPIMWKCTTKLMFACNELPFNGDFSHGLYRRLIILPFRNTFSHERGNLDPLILKKLLTERSDIFRYCLEQFAKTKARGYKFIEPKVAIEEMNDYQEMGDVVSRFSASMCSYTTTITNPLLPLEQVYNLFAMWCKDNHQNLISYGSFARRFGKVIMKMYPRIERSRPRSDSAAGGRGVAYKGLIVRATTNF